MALNYKNECFKFKKHKIYLILPKMVNRTANNLFFEWKKSLLVVCLLINTYGKCYDY